jgi:zinc protease
MVRSVIDAAARTEVSFRELGALPELGSISDAVANNTTQTRLRYSPTIAGTGRSKEILMNSPLKVITMPVWFALAAILCMMPLKSNAMEDNLKRFTLSNGLEVIVKEDHARKVATLQLWVMVGSADETAAEGGISHLIEHMAFKGTQRRGVGQIAAEVEALGGDTNAYTSWDETVFYVTVPSEAAVAGLDIITDAVLRPAIDPKELDKEKQVVLEEILEGDERPERKASKLILKTAYAASPYRFPIIGYKEIVEKFTRDDILSFRKKWYVPENMFLLVVGDVNAEQLRGEIERMTADLKPVGFFRPPRAMEPKQTKIRTALERDTNSRETRLHLAFHIPSVKHNDVSALDVAGDILGARESSRLIRAVKQEKKLVNSISAYAFTPKESGLFMIGATLDAKNLENATRAIMEELVLLAKEPPSPEELDRAKVHIESQHVYAGETVGGMARNIGNFRADLDDPQYEGKYLKLNAAVTAQDISRVVATYLAGENASVTVLLPEKDAQGFHVDQLAQIVNSFGASTAAVAGKTTPAGTVKTKTLSNGIRVALAYDDSNPVVALRIALMGGKRFESKENEGIMNFIAQMLTKGAGKLTEVEIARKVEDMGGRLYGFSGYDSFGLSANFFNRHLDDGLALLAELFCNPTFPQDKLERERELVLNRIKTEPDRPVAYTINVLNAALFERHPYGFVKEGTLTSVAGFTRADLQQTYERFAVPPNTVITAVGDMDLQKTMDRLEELFGKIPAKALDAPQVPAEDLLTQVRDKIVRIPRAKAHLALGFRGTSFADPDRYALDVLNNILAGMGGRLFHNLRDKQSLAYTVTSFDRPGLDPGAFIFYMACDEGKVDRAQEGLLKEIEDIREKAPNEAELTRSITNLVGNHLISLQSSWSRAENMALNTLYGLGYNYDQEYIKKIKEVKAADVARVAKKYLDPNRCALVKILPDEKDK